MGSLTCSSCERYCVNTICERYCQQLRSRDDKNGRQKIVVNAAVLGKNLVVWSLVWCCAVCRVYKYCRSLSLSPVLSVQPECYQPQPDNRDLLCHPPDLC